MDKIHTSVEAVRSQSLISLLPQDLAAYTIAPSSVSAVLPRHRPKRSDRRRPRYHASTRRTTHLLREVLSPVAARLAVRAHHLAA
jgi:hypothetical protein